MVKHIVILTGEASGDRLGANLIKNIKLKYNGEIKFSGIGGELMQTEGFSTILPMSDLSIIDYYEILINFPNLLNRIKQTVDYIIKKKPDLLITIDSKGFNKNVVKKLREKGYKGQIIHYVAPTVWAYKPERAKNFAKYFNHLISVLPMEAEYFIKEGLTTDYIGYPAVEIKNSTYQVEDFIKKYNIDPNKRIITLVPGSRRAEIRRIGPIILNAAKKLLDKNQNLFFIIPVTSSTRKSIEKLLDKFKFSAMIIDSEDRYTAFKASYFAITKSGTVAIELAVMQTPMVVVYKIDPLSAFVVKRMIKIPYINLINILLNKAIIPELLQNDCNAYNIFKYADNILNNEEEKTKQIEAFKQALEMLGINDNITPSEKAADIIINKLGS